LYSVNITSVYISFLVLNLRYTSSSYCVWSCTW